MASIDGGNKMQALTQNLVATTHRRVGRKRINAPDSDKMTARFPEGTLDRIKAVLRKSEPQSAFIREAVERELERREAETSKD